MAIQVSGSTIIHDSQDVQVSGMFTASSFVGDASQLTNLPASGGTLEATASGTLADGSKVIVNADGTVSVVAQTETTGSGVGSDVTFETGNTQHISSTYDPNNPSRDLDIALERLKKNIVLKYKNWGGHNVDGFNISFKYGRKFVKVLEGTRVWGFVAIDHDIHKNILYNKGDTFKPASWNAPAKWARGNVFHQNTDWYEWTGPNYLK